MYTTDAQLYDLKEYAKEKNLILTAGYGSAKEQNLYSYWPVDYTKPVHKEALHFLKHVFDI